MKLIDIVNAYNILSNIAKSGTAYTAKTSFAIARFLKKTADDHDLFLAKRDDLIRKYGKEDGEKIYVDENDSELFNSYKEELDQLCCTEVDGYKLTSDVVDELELSIPQALALLPVVDE